MTGVFGWFRLGVQREPSGRLMFSKHIVVLNLSFFFRFKYLSLFQCLVTSLKIRDSLVVKGASMSLVLVRSNTTWLLARIFTISEL